MSTDFPAIKELFYSKYRSADGLCRLSPTDTREPFAPGILETVQNNNGILFYSVFMLLCQSAGCLGLDDQLAFSKTVDLLEVQPGLFNRHLHDPMLEAADNYAAIALSGSSAEDIRKYGYANYWCFNNTNPGKFDFKALRQPGEVAYYKTMAGHPPAPWEVAWFAVGARLGSSASASAGTAQLLWVRLRGLRERLEDMPLWVRFQMEPIVTSNMARLKKVWGTPQVFLEQYYQDPNHPILAMARTLGEAAW